MKKHHLLLPEILEIVRLWLSREQRTPTMPEPSAKSKGEVFYGLMTKRLEEQFGTVETLASKVATWSTVPSLVITFLATILAVERDSFTLPTKILVTIGFVSYVISLLILYNAYRHSNGRMAQYGKRSRRMSRTPI